MDPQEALYNVLVGFFDEQAASDENKPYHREDTVAALDGLFSWVEGGGHLPDPRVAMRRFQDYVEDHKE